MTEGSALEAQDAPRGPRDPVGLAALQIAAALERIATALEGIVVEPAVVDAADPMPPKKVPGGVSEELPDAEDGVNLGDADTDDPVEDLLRQIQASEEP